MSLGFRSALLTRVGVQMTASAVRRQEMLPPLPSTYWRSHSLRPTSMISALMRLRLGRMEEALPIVRSRIRTRMPPLRSAIGEAALARWLPAPME